MIKLIPKILHNAFEQRRSMQQIRHIVKQLAKYNSKDSIINEIEIYRATSTIEESYEDLLLDVMDSIVGWCGSHVRIEEKCYIDEEPFFLETLVGYIEPLVPINQIESLFDFLSQKEWRWKIFNLITLIPTGYLANYGYLAEWGNKEYSTAVIPFNVAWLRRELYNILSHETKIPLHRIAKKGDVLSLSDSEKTKRYNDILRKMEGTIDKPKWM